ncbi:FecR family protein [Mangrovibacterium lignilyticum]|uniref:FecR family protein n=1 Tax=Mangrovibacterium lignilyticum TaxID=2668052 RepID=UPI0013D402AD|nr:FecR domain-containing protein [Mangrovibacterium lignilyticum]
MEKKLAEIIGRYLMRAESEEERRLLKQWEDNSPENQSFLNLLKQYWDSPENSEQAERMESAKGRLLIRTNETSTGKSLNKLRTINLNFKRIAAVLLIVLSVVSVTAYFLGQRNYPLTNNQFVISTLPGQKSKVKLPDGTSVWINSDTELEYSTDRNNRIVTLSGEAYFEVAHSKDHPFVVKLGGWNIRVLGTKFNVSNYPESEMKEASLLEGKISVQTRNHEADMEIIPGEKITFNAKTKDIVKEKASVKDDILWVDGVLLFNNESFQEIVLRLEKYYGVSFEYNPDDFKNIHYTGQLDNLSLRNVLEFMSLTMPVKYKIEKNKVIITRK